MQRGTGKPPSRLARLLPAIAAAWSSSDDRRRAPGCCRPSPSPGAPPTTGRAADELGYPAPGRAPAVEGAAAGVVVCALPCRLASSMAAAAAAKLVLLVAVVAGVAGSGGAWELRLRMPTAQSMEAAAERLKEEVAAPVIHALRPLMGSAGDLGRRGGVPCDSWRLAVETYNKRDWRTVPARCEKYVGNYMMGGHYRSDSRAVVDEAIAYAEGLKLSGNGKEVWVFDIDETSLSNLPYYATHGFGTTLYNATAFNNYVLEGSAPVLPETQRLFKKLISLGIKPVFLTGRTEDQRAITVANLRREGYSGWMKLLLKTPGFKGSAIAYKSGERQKLQDAGYVIVGNIGDQWSDILGAPEGARTFKLPDPLYYIG